MLRSADRLMRLYNEGLIQKVNQDVQLRLLGGWVAPRLVNVKSVAATAIGLMAAAALLICRVRRHVGRLRLLVLRHPHTVTVSVVARKEYPANITGGRRGSKAGDDGSNYKSHIFFLVVHMPHPITRATASNSRLKVRA